MWEHSFGNGVWVAVVVLWDDICVCAYVGAKWGVGVREPVQVETRMGPFCVHRGRVGRVQKTRGSREGWVRRYDEDAEACCNFCE